MSKAKSSEEDEEAVPPPASSSRWLSRHGSLRQAAGQLSRRLAARLSLTRQRSLGGALGRRDADADADADDDGDPYEEMNSRAAPLPLSSPVRFSLPKATSSYDGFLMRGRLLSTPHQRSCDSHDESVASATSAAGSSRGSVERGSVDFGAAWAGTCATKMDMMNFGKKSDEPDEDDKKDDASIKGLWKRAFTTLRIRDKEKTPKKKKGGKDEDDVADDVDPVYSLLKRAADKGVQKCTGCTPESGVSPLSAMQAGKSGDSLQSGLAAAASPCQEIPQCRGADCLCLCHNPLQLLVPSITLNDLKPRPKVRKSKSRSKSLAQTPQSLPQQPPPKPPPKTPPPLPAASGMSPDSAAWGGRGRMASLREGGSLGRQQQQE